MDEIIFAFDGVREGPIGIRFLLAWESSSAHSSRDGYNFFPSNFNLRHAFGNDRANTVGPRIYRLSAAF
ncbi:MAG: hypothetical protein ABSA16_02405 [Thermoguttaceae bacterium]|jgi:hypothetical protein